MLTYIKEYKIVAIIRGAQPDYIMRIANALYEGGIRILEVTLNSPDALNVIAALAASFNNKMLVGAGTVITIQDANNAIAAGARFLISPSLDMEVIKAAKKAGIVSIPGAFTPTEIVTAYRNGADIVKVFPALSPDYIKNILAPLNHIPLMPTGGVSVDNIQAYREAGAVAFGIGSALVSNKSIVDETYLQNLTNKAQSFISAIQTQQRPS